jgi:mRNA interferase MazF
MIYSRAEIVLAELPFSSGSGSKARPALVIFDTGDQDALLARITSRTRTTPFDLAIFDWQLAGLRGPGSVRIHKLNTTAKSLIHSRIGILTPSDHQRIAAVLNQMFGGW